MLNYQKTNNRNSSDAAVCTIVMSAQERALQVRRRVLGRMNAYLINTFENEGEVATRAAKEEFMRVSLTHSGSVMLSDDLYQLCIKNAWRAAARMVSPQASRRNRNRRTVESSTPGDQMEWQLSPVTKKKRKTKKGEGKRRFKEQESSTKKDGNKKLRQAA